MTPLDRFEARARAAFLAPEPEPEPVPEPEPERPMKMHALDVLQPDFWKHQDPGREVRCEWCSERTVDLVEHRRVCPNPNGRNRG
jgi:hypothetical protein